MPAGSARTRWALPEEASVLLGDSIRAGSGMVGEASRLISPPPPFLSLSFPLPETCLCFPFARSHTAFEPPPSAQCVSDCAARVTFRLTVLEEIAWIWKRQNTKFNQPRGPWGSRGGGVRARFYPGTGPAKCRCGTIPACLSLLCRKGVNGASISPHSPLPIVRCLL